MPQAPKTPRRGVLSEKIRVPQNALINPSKGRERRRPLARQRFPFGAKKERYQTEESSKKGTSEFEIDLRIKDQSNKTPETEIYVFMECLLLKEGGDSYEKSPQEEQPAWRWLSASKSKKRVARRGDCVVKYSRECGKKKSAKVSQPSRGHSEERELH